MIPLTVSESAGADEAPSSLGSVQSPVEVSSSTRNNDHDDDDDDEAMMDSEEEEELEGGGGGGSGSKKGKMEWIYRSVGYGP